MPQSGAIDVRRFASPAAARPRLPRNQHSVSPIGGESSSAFNSHFGATVAPSRGAIKLKGSPMTNPKLEVLPPQNSQLIFIDHQPQMAFGVQSIDRQTLKNNVVALAKAAKVFKVPTTITSVETHRAALSREILSMS